MSLARLREIARPRPAAAVARSVTVEFCSWCGLGWLPDPGHVEVLDWFCVGWARIGPVRGPLSEGLSRKLGGVIARMREALR